MRFRADLSGGNVMLRTAEDCRHGLAAKVADFGLSRIMDVQSRMQTRMYGTVRLRAVDHAVCFSSRKPQLLESCGSGTVLEPHNLNECGCSNLRYSSGSLFVHKSLPIIVWTHPPTVPAIGARVAYCAATVIAGSSRHLALQQPHCNALC